MMRKFIGLAALLCLFSMGAMAQDYSKFEAFGGYQYTHLESSYNANGWNAAFTGKFNHYLGVTADFSGAYNRGLDFHTYTFGPVLSLGRGPIRPYVHALFGGSTASGAGSSDSGFTMFVGGGVDAGSQHIAWRVLQADWEYDRFNGFNSSKNVRASTGIVFRF